MAEVKEKIKNVEFLRILGMFTILLFHLAIKYEN